MRVCVVGNGPSAEGRGEEIDGYDFVVRMRNWWRCGAENAGTKCDAHAYFDWWAEWETDPCLGEHWFTWCPEQLKRAGENGWHKLAMVNARAKGALIRWLTDERWKLLNSVLHEHPSTGIVTVTMALDVFYDEPVELGLYGFDSTTPDRPRYFDAREENKVAAGIHLVAHNVLAEKRLLLGLRQSKWITGKEDITLVWPDQPELP